MHAGSEDIQCLSFLRHLNGSNSTAKFHSAGIYLNQVWIGERASRAQAAGHWSAGIGLIKRPFQC